MDPSEGSQSAAAAPGGEPVARPRPRIESLSDMVFGLALSVGALALVASPPTNAGQMYSDLSTFAFSFLILILVWFAYTRIMSVMPLEDRRTLMLNTILLFSVSIEPFLFNLVNARTLEAEPAFWNAISQAYALDLALMSGVLAFFCYDLATIDAARIGPGTAVQFRRSAIRWSVNATLFVISIAPIFDVIVTVGTTHTPVRVIMWIVPLILSGGDRAHWEPRRRSGRMAPAEGV